MKLLNHFRLFNSVNFRIVAINHGSHGTQSNQVCGSLPYALKGAGRAGKNKIKIFDNSERLFAELEKVKECQSH